MSFGLTGHLKIRIKLGLCRVMCSIVFHRRFGKVFAGLELNRFAASGGGILAEIKGVLRGFDVKGLIPQLFS